MLRPRIICSLLMDGDDLVKTMKFEDPFYVGDPINTIRIFNEKKTDEICIFDISSYKQKKINFDILKSVAQVSRMPISYGGGINSMDTIEKILSLGIEKVVLNSAIFIDDKFNLISESSKKFGAQSIAVCVDIFYDDRKKEYYATHKYSNKKIKLKEYLLKLKEYELGEIILYSVNFDGCMSGYDENMLNQFYSNIDSPVTIMGGAGNIKDLETINNKFDISGFACASIFCFKQKRGTVLINYFSDSDKQKLTKFS